MIKIGLPAQERNEFKDDDLVCYCFRHTKRDIENDLRENGRSMIYERIVAEKKSGGCNCAEENPKGK